MSSAELPQPVTPGRPAPHFTLPAVDGNAPISLSDYRGRSPLFLALLIGLWCPFCRRQIAQIGAIEGKLKAEGIEALGIVATLAGERETVFQIPADTPATCRRSRAQDPPRVRAAETDPHARVHAGDARRHASTRLAIFPSHSRSLQAVEAVAKADGYTENDTDKADMERQWPQLKGQFLIDRDGIVRWAISNARPRAPLGSENFPPVEEIIAAARMLQ